MTRRTRVLFAAAVAFVGLVAVAIGATAWYVDSLARQFDERTTKIAEPFPVETVRPAPPTGEPAHAQNILLLGSDTRESVESVDDVGARSDTIMVVHIPADRGRVTVMSIMRDSWVDIPGHGEAKINAAMAWGGTPLTVQTVESIIGVRIDHVVMVDFEGFGEITEALGGVEVENAIEFEVAGQYFPQGRVHLDGVNALNFVRERYEFVDADYQRVRNQQAFMRAVAAKLVSTSTALDAGRIQNLVTAVSPYLAVDAGFDSAYVAKLAFELRGLRPDDVSFVTAPTLGTATSSDGQSIVVLDDVRIGAIRQAFVDDQLAVLPLTTFQ